jgi:hypothetical protein
MQLGSFLSDYWLGVVTDAKNTLKEAHHMIYQKNQVKPIKKMGRSVQKHSYPSCYLSWRDGQKNADYCLKIKTIR